VTGERGWVTNRVERKLSCLSTRLRSQLEANAIGGTGPDRTGDGATVLFLACWYSCCCWAADDIRRGHLRQRARLQSTRLLQRSANVKWTQYDIFEWTNNYARRERSESQWLRQSNLTNAVRKSPRCWSTDVGEFPSVRRHIYYRYIFALELDHFKQRVARVATAKLKIWKWMR